MSNCQEFPDSTSVRQICFDEEKSELEVSFRDKHTYVYYNVPASVFQEILSAESVGRYVAKNITKKYKYSKKP